MTRSRWLPGRADRHDEPAADGELREQRLGHALGSGRHEDPVVGRRRRIPVGPVERLHRHVVAAERRQERRPRRARARRSARASRRCGRAARGRPSGSPSPSRSRAPCARARSPSRWRHHPDDVGLRDRLAEADRQRVVAVGPRPQGLRDEEVARHLRIASRTRGSSTPRGATKRATISRRRASSRPARPGRLRSRGGIAPMIAGEPAAARNLRGLAAFVQVDRVECGVASSETRSRRRGGFACRKPRTSPKSRASRASPASRAKRSEKWYALMHLGARARRQGSQLSQAGSRLELPRALRRARRDPARARHDVPARPRLPLPLLPRPDDLRRRRPDGRGDPPERHVQGDRRRLRRPAHVEPLRQALDRHPERLVLRLEPRAARRRPRPRDQDLSPGRDRLLLGRRVLDLRGLLLRGRQRRVAREARRSSSSSRTTATASRCRRATRRRTSTRPTTSRGFKNLKIIHCDGLDVFDSFRAMREAVDVRPLGRRARRSCTRRVVRIHSHSNSDRQELYRTPEELAAARAADPAAPLPQARSSTPA